MSEKISPLAPTHQVDLPVLAGVKMFALAAGIRYKNREDLVLFELASGTQIAGVFTTSKASSAPVDWCRQSIANGKARGIIVNAGNANAFTGYVGFEHTKIMAQAVAMCLKCAESDVMVASTGVIGETLNIDKVMDAMPALYRGLGEAHWEKAAKAIMTTDTFVKKATASAQIKGQKITINGIAKGSGMIAPDMATMLGFVFTDANIPANLLQQCLTAVNRKTFNCVTVDGDTSTSDTLLLAATCQAHNEAPVSMKDLRSFKAALTDVMQDLAIQVARDGEGASKLICIDVVGATSSKAAHKIAMSIANSPLVKTAIAGEDANWGRVVMAIGKAGEKADRDLLKVSMGGQVICENGKAAEQYNESLLDQHLKGDEISIHVDLGLGRSKSKVWTCDLTYDYIRINADYRS